MLVRTWAAYPGLLEAFDAHDVPVQHAGRTGLFARLEVQMFGRTYAWLVDHRWSSGPRARGGVPTDDEAFDGYRDLYGLDDAGDKLVRERLLALKDSFPSEDRPVSLVADFYELLGDLGVAGWDADDPMTSSRLGTLARCSSILADYEAVRRRSRRAMACCPRLRALVRRRAAGTRTLRRTVRDGRMPPPCRRRS